MAEATANVRVGVNARELTEAKEKVTELTDRWQAYTRELPRSAQEFRHWNSALEQFGRLTNVSVERLQSMRGIEQAITTEHERRIRMMQEGQRLTEEFNQNQEAFYGSLISKGMSPRALGGIPGIQQTLATEQTRDATQLAEIEQLQARAQTTLTRAQQLPAPRAGGREGGELSGEGGRFLREVAGLALGYAGIRTFGQFVEGQLSAQDRVSRAVLGTSRMTGASAQQLEGPFADYARSGPAGDRAREFFMRAARLGVGSADLMEMTREHAGITGKTPTPDAILGLAAFGQKLTGESRSGVVAAGEVYRRTYETEEQTQTMFNALTRFSHSGRPLQELMSQNVHLLDLISSRSGAPADSRGAIALQSALQGLGKFGRGEFGVQTYMRMFHPETAGGQMQGLTRLFQMEAFGEVTGRSAVGSLKEQQEFKDIFERGGLEEGTPKAGRLRAAYARHLLSQSDEMIQAELNTTAKMVRRLRRMRPDQWEGRRGQRMMRRLRHEKEHPGEESDAVRDVLEATKDSTAAQHEYARAIKEVGDASLTVIQQLLDRVKQFAGEHPIAGGIIAGGLTLGAPAAYLARRKIGALLKYIFGGKAAETILTGAGEAAVGAGEAAAGAAAGAAGAAEVAAAAAPVATGAAEVAGAATAAAAGAGAAEVVGAGLAAGAGTVAGAATGAAGVVGDLMFPRKAGISPAQEKHAMGRKHQSVSGAGWREYARRYAESIGLDPNLAEAMIEQESDFTMKRGAAGEAGMTQIMPATARGLHLDFERLKRDPAYNIQGGLGLLKSLVTKYGETEGVARYNSSMRSAQARERGNFYRKQVLERRNRIALAHPVGPIPRNLPRPDNVAHQRDPAAEQQLLSHAASAHAGKPPPPLPADMQPHMVEHVVTVTPTSALLDVLPMATMPAHDTMGFRR